MTEGKIIPQLTGFTIPLVLGNLFQLTYNAADSVIVGKFVGDDALAAVGTAGPIMNMVILFISGMCMGAGILMSTQYGAKKYGQLERQVSTAMIGGIGFSIGVTVLLMIFACPLLGLLQVPQDIIGSAAVYLRIIFGGLIFTFIYNFFSNTLRALGACRAARRRRCSARLSAVCSVSDILKDKSRCSAWEESGACLTGRYWDALFPMASQARCSRCASSWERFVSRPL